MPVDRIARLVAPRRCEIASEETGSPAAGQVLVRVVACGVCASELHAWEDPDDFPAADRAGVFGA